MDANGVWVIVATAHPAKFAEVIEPLMHSSVQIPTALKDMLSKKQHYSIIEPNYQSLSHYLKN
jgi:threonine synthase